MAQIEPNVTAQPTHNETVSFGEWVGTFVLLLIPIVGFILMLVWAFGSGAKPSKRNFARAYFLVWVIGLVVGIVTFLATASSLAALLSGLAGMGY